jgi:hypothetical protein
MTTVQTLRTARPAAPLLARGAYCYDGASGSLQFSWKQVGLSALSAGVGSGLGSLAATPGSFLAEIGPVGRAIVGNVTGQGIGVATGLQEKFSWRSVAASAVGAGVGQAVAPAMGEAFGKVGGRFATSLIAGTATAVARGGKVAIQQVATDAFANAVGASLVEASSGISNPSSADYVNQMDRASDHSSLQSTYDSRNGADVQSDNAYVRKLSDAAYGLSTGNDGLGLNPVTGVGTVGMRYQGVRSPMFDDTRIFSDSNDPNALMNVGQDGSPTAQVPPLFNPTAAGGAGAGIVGGGYQVVRPYGAGGSPGYDIVRDLPAGAPGYSQANPSLGLGAPPKLANDRSWTDFVVEGLPLPTRALVGLLDNLMFKRPSDILGNNLEAAGYSRPEGTAAHHIVPYGDQRAQNVRDKLADLGIDLNSANNGVFLPQVPGSAAPGAYHPSLNSDAYNNQLRRDFERVNSRQRALDTLGNIRGQLLNGTYPGSKPVPPKL